MQCLTRVVRQGDDADQAVHTGLIQGRDQRLVEGARTKGARGGIPHDRPVNLLDVVVVDRRQLRDVGRGRIADDY